jgi:hypothetical protein
MPDLVDHRLNQDFAGGGIDLLQELLQAIHVRKRALEDERILNAIDDRAGRTRRRRGLFTLPSPLAAPGAPSGAPDDAGAI